MTPQLWIFAGPNGAGKSTIADLLRRFDRSLANLRLAAGLADRIILIDNSGDRRQLVLSREDGRIKYAAPTLPAWATDV